MNLMMLLEMAAAAHGERVAVQCGGEALRFEELFAASGAAARELQASGAAHLALLDVSSLAAPVALFAAARAGVPYVPLNYRLTGDELDALLERITPAKLVTDPDRAARFSERAGSVRRGARRLPRRRPRGGRSSRLAGRSRGHRGAALHERNHRGAQGGRAPPPPPRLLRARLRRVRERGRGRGGARLGAALPRGGSRRDPELRLCRAAHRPAPELQRRGMARGRTGGARDPRLRRADDARAHRRRPRRTRERRSPAACEASPTGEARCRFP